MNILQFLSGNYIEQYNYKSFSPSVINHDWIISDAEIIYLLSEADRKLGELNAFSMLIPNVDFFIQMHITKEATQSSKIEGTQTTIEEALQRGNQIDPEKRDDWQEVHNYIEAMNFAIAQLNKLPLSNRLMKQTHKILLEGVRGKHKRPGEFRSSQNWIGGISLKDAIYIPPHHNELMELMSDLEKFLNNDPFKIPHLIRIGIAHYQFETIHPFLDGNGRLGRLLITLYLISNHIISKPALYLSDFFEKNRNLYYENLTLVRTKNDLVRWLKFFLVGVFETANNSIETFKKIIKLKHTLDEKKLPALGKRMMLGKDLLNYLYKKPLVDAAEVANALNINITTANRLIQEFERLKILVEKTGFKRNRIFVFEAYLNIFKK